MKKTFRTQLREALEVPRDLLLRRYPPFVTGGDLPRGHVPVFVFHGVSADEFGAKLDYLASNGYVTLSVREYLDVLTGKAAAPPRAVLLTFDDGRRSVFTNGLPLMQRYGAKGVVFLVPGRAPAEPEPATDDGLMTWHDVRTLARSSLFDIESHSLTHARVHVAPRVVDFVTPADTFGYAAMDVPLIQAGGSDLLAGGASLGTPLLQSAPRLSEAMRFHEDEAIRSECVRIVRDEGGVAFFERPDWRKRLRRAVPRGRVGGRLETDRERRLAITRELVESKRLIEEHVGSPVEHLCYPWHVAGPTAEAVAIEAGYRTAFCGKVPGVPLTPPGGDPRRIARIGEDYVETLPGKGRVSIVEILRRKWARRFPGQ